MRRFNWSALVFLAAVPGVLEVSIGQALVADALHMGLGPAVGAYLSIVRASAAISE